MFKRTKSPSPILSSPSPALESQPRNPRVHRQSGIPSINRPRRLSGAVANETNTPYTAKSSATKTPYQHPGLPREPNLQISTPSSHRRIVSMPQPLPSVIQAQIDIDGDRIARGLISPPIVDFTRFDDQYRGPRNGYFEGLITKMKKTKGRSHSIKPILKRNSCSGVKNNNAILEPHPASTRKPDPRLIVSTLELLIIDPLKKPADVLDIYDLLGMHQLDQLDFEEREIERGNSGKRYPRGEMVVLGEPLRKASIYASTTMVLGGREHELPIIVVSCIEELYRTGIYQCNLFRTLPNRSRLLELINIFDSEQQPPGSIIRSRQSLPSKSSAKSGFGANTSLHLESTPDICALLSTYLSALPEPILLPALFRPIWDWCGIDEDEVDTSELKSFRRRMSVSLPRTHTNPTESTRILISQFVLHLLPSPHFSLLVYILAFFSQVAMVHEENGVGMDDLARMFGGRIFGGGQSRRRKLSSEIAVEDPHQPRMEGEVMMCWFLRRWSLISEGLFDVVEDAKVGVFQDQQLQDRLLSLERKRCSVSIPLGDSLENGGIPNHSSGRDTPFRLPLLDDASHSCESPKVLSQPHPHDESSLNTRLNSKYSKNNGLDEVVVDLDKSFDYEIVLSPVDGRSLDASFTIPTATNIDGNSIYSATALDERLLDVSIPTLLDQTFPIESFHGDDNDSRLGVQTSIAKPKDETDQKFNQRILVLEAEVEKSNKAATELLQELSKEKLRCSDLESRIGELELALELEKKKKEEEKEEKEVDQKDGAESNLDDEHYGRMLQIAKKERDDALELVRGIRKLMD